LKFSVLTIFPELFQPFCQLGLFGRALASSKVSVEFEQLRDFAINSQGQIDDTPCGGGSGMVLRPDAGIPALEKLRSKNPAAKVVYFSPRGQPLSHALLQQIMGEVEEEEPEFILLCGRYEGVDQRVIDKCVDYEVSLGDFVLMGGELPAMAFMESISRFVPEVLGNPESLAEESFSAHLLEYPQYTKPREFEGMEVPEVLLSGDHGKVEQWRLERAVADTRERRPDLYREYVRSAKDSRPSSYYPSSINVALVHHPVLNKEGKIITSSVTNLDLHDIARSSRSFGVDSYFIAHPSKTLRKLLAKICEHWSEGYGYHYNPNRSDALNTVSIVPEFDEILSTIERREGRLPKIIVTSARKYPNSLSFGEMKITLATLDEPVLLVFGTGWGLSEDFMSRADYVLEPIYGVSDFNHLSVRAAAAIILDRLLGI
jgi:tRNA (guanine37-N1)-methyltransferase